MRRDLIVGILISLALHVGILGGEDIYAKLFGPHRQVVKKVKTEDENIVKMDLPPPEPEKEEEVQELNDEPVVNQMAPPSLVDMPTVVPVNAFTQPIQPPPPPGLTATKGAISIPVVKPGSQLGKGMKDLFDVANLDQPPVLRVPVSPTYPFEMRRAGISGEVLVEFIVDTKGDVVAVQVIRSSQREFEQPAIQAVQKWKFRPGRKGGRAVNTRAQQPITFNLNDE
jgi:periplasmic protein TonB